MTRMQTVSLALAAGVLCGSVQAVIAQTCEMRLSNLETAIVSLDDRLDEIEDDVSAEYQHFARLEAHEASEPGSCPDTLPNSRAQAAAMPISGVAAHSDHLLACAQSFVIRVTADIEQARATNDSQLIVRLGDLQQRILNALETTTELAGAATFWALRQERLVAQYDAVSRRCEILSEFYDGPPG